MYLKVENRLIFESKKTLKCPTTFTYCLGPIKYQRLSGPASRISGVARVAIKGGGQKGCGQLRGRNRGWSLEGNQGAN